jgi:hypothetical protein
MERFLSHSNVHFIHEILLVLIHYFQKAICSAAISATTASIGPHSSSAINRLAARCASVDSACATESMLPCSKVSLLHR